MASLPNHRQPDAELPPTPPQSLKERQRQEREQLILLAAMDLLIEKGYHQTSMDEIASRVGISKGAVYLHFPSKEDLISALFERGAHSVMGALNEALASGGSPREKLSEIIRVIYGSMSKRFQLMSAASQSPELHRLLAAKHDALVVLWEEPARRVAGVIDEGKRLGEFDRTLPTPLVVAFLWNLLTPRGFQQLVTHGGMPVDEVVAHLSRYFFKGIAAEEPTTMEGEDE